jgi:hypothetical protein
MKPMSRPAEAERCFPSHSPTLRPWIDDRSGTITSYVEELWSPIPGRFRKKCTLKHTRYFLRYLQRRSTENLSLSGGASIRPTSSSS